MSGSSSSRSAPRARHDEWSAERPLAFLNALSLGRSVAKAARAVGTSREGAYRLRVRCDGALFAVRWDQILCGRFIALAPAPAPPPGHESHASGVAFVCAPDRVSPSRS